MGLAVDEEDEETEVADLIKGEVKRFLRPELINRFDDIIVFEKLTDTDLSKILDMMVQDLASRLEDKHGIAVSIDNKVKEHILSQVDSRNFGARPLRRCLERLVEDHIAKVIIKDTADKTSSLTVAMENGTVTIK